MLVLGFRPARPHLNPNPNPHPHPLTIRFRNCVGDRPLLLSEGAYTNRFGEPFSVQQFKYYISDIWIIGQERAEERLSDEPHLVDQGDSSSLVLHLPATLSGIRSIRFVIGVDSLANVSGVQTADLDPMLGMFWTWNTGYIDARLEGISDSAHSPAHRFTWDIGGYKGTQNAVRQITLTIPGADQTSAENMIPITADLLKWFDGKQPIRIAHSPVCHQPGSLAMQIADNYSTMFSVEP